MSALLEVQGLAKRFGSLRALDGVDLTVEEGRLTGLIGPNGAGKSTAFGCIAGALKPSAGSVRFRGVEIAGTAYHRVARLGIGRTYQIVQTFADMTVLEATTTGALMRRPRLRDAIAHAREVLTFVGLEDKRYRLGRALTIADKKRLEVARALATEPSLLLLDEVMAGLTPAECRDAVDLLRRILARGVTVLMVEHVMEVLMPIADRIVVIAAGKTIFAGTAGCAVRDRRVVDAYLGSPLEHGAIAETPT
ncbi:ABC transporter ATP-binding protein [Vulcanimicrobium alpinum]|uniref:ABC transporter ATP-binding protein n=1 Tax=Vulcanimicrobium alpinum TaxID=3016050 RepID=A0AAN1XYP6_UNVUL|nr:ABC transporter ATP-binding protein [Vulcanimicrobium alpinum]BDE07818.1 ABC transporter ATP-binding protein [Vulcanimicrobium alpinum]